MKKKVVIFVALIGIVIITVVISLCNIFITGKQSITGFVNNSYNINDTRYNVYSYITKEMENNSEKLVPMASFKNEYTTDYLLEKADAIAIVTIVSIDGSSAEYSPMFGMTYGKLLVNNVIRGNIESGNLLNYLKPGGIMTVENWEQYQDPESNEKREYLRQKNGVTIDKKNTYINIKLEDDIDMIAGKTYLAYLNYIETYQKYEIIGLNIGLREVNIVKTSKVSIQNLNFDNLKIKNNKTGEWESLNGYVESYINK